jgi:small-conductance mechanosensitive channel
MDTVFAPWLDSPLIRKALASAVVILLIVIVVRLVNRWLRSLIPDVDMRYRSRKVVSFLGYLAAALVITAIFAQQLGSLTVAFGVAGAGIAFALQEVIASIAGWMAVSMGQFFRTGDRVRLGGIRGDVIDIGVLRTTIMECGDWVDGDLYNGRIVRVANSFVFKEPVFNYSGDFPFLWDEFMLAFRHGSDPALIRELFARVLQAEVGEYADFAKKSWKSMVQKYRIEEAQIEPMITLVANDSSMQFTARYVVDYRRRRITKDRIFTKLLDEITATDGRVKLSTTSLEVVGAPTLDVRVSDGSAPA